MMKSTRPMGPYGGGWALIRNGEMPSKMATERGAPTRSRRATPAAIIAVTGVLLWRDRRSLDVLGLGRDMAVALGVDHRRIVLRLLVIVSLLVSVSTALVGPVTFFGLLVASLAHQLTGSHRHAVLLPAAVLLAVLALVGGQTVLEHVFDMSTVLSVLIEFLGGIVFLLLVMRGARR